MDERPENSNISIPSNAGRRLSAIMFTDIKGFTSLMETDEATAVGLVKAQREIIRREIAKHGGEERETIGDAFLVIFESAINAVRCAMAIQQALWEYNIDKEEGKRVWVRIGIHLGDILIEEGSVFGEGVNLAARVEPLAEAGGICITQQVLDQVRHSIDIKVRRLSVRELKNVTDVPRLYHIVLSTVAPRGPLSLKEKLSLFMEEPKRVAAVCGALALILAGVLYFIFFATHISYSFKIATLQHVPSPRFEMGRSFSEHADNFLKTVRKGRRVISVREFDDPEALTEDAKRTWEAYLGQRARRDFPVRKFRYSGGRLSDEYFYDDFNVLQYRLSYDKDGRVATAYDANGYVKTFENQIASFAYDLDKNGRIAKIENRNAFGELRSDLNNAASYRYAYNGDDLPIEVSTFDVSGNPAENKSGVATIVYSYNDSGLVPKESYLDRYRAVQESVNGYAAVEYEYDKYGRMTLKKYFDRQGMPVVDNRGACAVRFEYDDRGRLVSETTLDCRLAPKDSQGGYATRKFGYDSEGRMDKESFFSSDGKPAADASGISSTVLSHYEGGRLASTSFFGPDGNKAVNRELAHAVQLRYDDGGRVVSRISLGADGEPTIGSGGFAEMRIQYDDRGNATEEAFFDAGGALVNSKNGYAMIKSAYDQFGNAVSVSYFDKRGDPSFGREERCHRIEYKYNDRGGAAETRCYDGDGKLAAGIRNCAVNKYERDMTGKLTRFECYVDEGRLIEAPSIPAILEIKYDKRGYLNEVRAYDSNKKLAERYQGAAIWRRVSDEYGNEIEIATYDRNERLINNPKFNAAIFRREFDGRGNQTRIRLFDVNEQPTEGIWGFTEVRFAYDEGGRVVSESFFSGDGAPSANSQGVHEYKKAYDGNGRLASLSNFGPDGSPVADAAGAASTGLTYDERGNTATVSYFDPAGLPAENAKMHCASLSYVTDDSGNTAQIKCFGVGGSLCEKKECVAVTEQSFNARGQLVQKIFKDALGKRTLNDKGAGGYEFEYDAQGRVSAERVLSTGDLSSKDSDGVFGYRLFYRPDFDKTLWFEVFLGADGRPTRSAKGADARLMIYDELYRESAKARADVKVDGRAVETLCLDRVGNPLPNAKCVTAAEVKKEFEKALPFIKSLSSP